MKLRFAETMREVATTPRPKGVGLKLDGYSPLPPGRGTVASDCDDGSVMGA